PAKRIKVEFLDGTVAVRGKSRAFSPLSFLLKEGETRSIRITTAKGKKKTTVGYRNGVLYLDGNPSNVRQRSAAAKIDFSPAWNSGRTYRVNTRGKLNFKGLKVRIKRAD
ncbi:MAG: hypothetical protein GWO11_00950, partial [Desulfuromonadales bacterium]|nr:hypothetical protein [Desulfuromonadales bacterium]NIR33078.1 hypothetical protein [Desulfuromonadales bacterium]NIS39316.1 hypothetical protein [Desulfuromonadales bacterium]